MSAGMQVNLPDMPAQDQCEPAKYGGEKTLPWHCCLCTVYQPALAVVHLARILC